ncbi:hypothetical protein D2E76_16415 [Mycobacteroides abscessus]|uniref:Uncharacterized protein n=1 Tax=Mycobacteroides abscessus TaxID=36809 RepID=A0ABD7HM97_9MYCO|nr:hypothetical protein D2E76_16415 [Mycobacteroides abscessus]
MRGVNSTPNPDPNVIAAGDKVAFANQSGELREGYVESVYESGGCEVVVSGWNPYEPRVIWAGADTIVLVSKRTVSTVR